MAIDHDYLTGFTEGTGTFTYSRVGNGVTLYFAIKSYAKDLSLLLKIRDYFQAGKVYRGKAGKSQWVYFRVNKLGELIKVVAHFERYPLLGAKQFAFEVWKEMVACKRRKLDKDKVKLLELAEKLSRANGA